MLNEAIVSRRQKEKGGKKKKEQAVPLLSAPTLRSILQNDEVHSSIQACHHLKMLKQDPHFLQEQPPTPRQKYEYENTTTVHNNDNDWVVSKKMH